MIFTSCNDEEIIKPNQISNTQNNNLLITEEYARQIASNISFENLNSDSNYGVNLKNTVPNHNKKIDTLLIIPDNNNKPALYIINYKDGGFIVLAGDRRSEPILAFSEINSFDLDQNYYPSGLIGWLFDSKENITRLRNANVSISPGLENQWDNLEHGLTDVISCKLIEDPGEDCTPYTIQVGPLLQTIWDQDCGYNSETPSMSCVPCYHAYTGCVATAMAQVMRYHQYPNNYNWSGMPNDYGNAAIATLMRDIGDFVNMDYSCDGSSAELGEIASSFTNDFGYSTATTADYYHNTVKSELSQSRPVILTGGRNTGWWIFGQFSDGHAWVCDGFLNYVDPCYGSFLKFNMNWGWGGSYNGWYSFNNFNPGEHTFNYKRRIVYNIKP